MMPMKVSAFASILVIVIASGCGSDENGTTQPPPNGTDSSGWSALDPLGVQGVANLAAVVEYRSHLYVGGEFTRAGESAVTMLARFDGSAWHPVPGPWQPDRGAVAQFRGVKALQVFDDALFVAGAFEGDGDAAVPQWDGTTLAAPPMGPGGVALAFAQHTGGLHVGGYLRHHGGNTPPTCDDFSDRDVLRWGGTGWTHLYRGFRGVDGSTSGLALVSCMASYEGTLVLAGNFTWVYDCTGSPEQIQSHGAGPVAQWDGVEWEWLAGARTVHDVVTYGGELIVAGAFTEIAGVAAQNIARYDGSAWHPLGDGVNDVVCDLQVYNGDLVAAGVLTSAGGVAARRIARWNGTTWRSLGDGVTGEAVTALGIYQGNLIAAGIFTEAGDVEVHNIARWSD